MRPVRRVGLAWIAGAAPGDGVWEVEPDSTTAPDALPLQGAASIVLLVCDGCGTTADAGPFASYEDWEDTARQLGWHVGEDSVLCAECVGVTG